MAEASGPKPLTLASWSPSPRAAHGGERKRKDRRSKARAGRRAASLRHSRADRGRGMAVGGGRLKGWCAAAGQRGLSASPLLFVDAPFLCARLFRGLSRTRSGRKIAAGPLFPFLLFLVRFFVSSFFRFLSRRLSAKENWTIRARLIFRGDESLHFRFEPNGD
jgi:hypothetical protein